MENLIILFIGVIVGVIFSIQWKHASSNEENDCD